MGQDHQPHRPYRPQPVAQAGERNCPSIWTAGQYLCRAGARAQAQRKAEENRKTVSDYKSQTDSSEISSTEDGIAIEESTKSGRKIKKITVTKYGISTVYRRVEHQWGAVYYFREMENISKSRFDLETKKDD